MFHLWKAIQIESYFFRRWLRTRQFKARTHFVQQMTEAYDIKVINVNIIFCPYDRIHFGAQAK